MSSLYTKYRPTSFSSLVGQENIVGLLQAELIESKTSHAYIFIGPRGTGKTTTARILAKAINCLKLTKDGSPCDDCANCKAFAEGKFLDLIEIDAASNRGIDEIRELKEKIEFKPSQGKYKVYIIDEVHMLTKEAFNALLKTLEEPPEHVVFILATTEPHKIPMTILSRCERIEFRLGSESNIITVLGKVLSENKIKVQDEALNLIAQLSGGSYRDALSLLDTVISSATDDGITKPIVQRVLGIPHDDIVNSYVTAILSANESEALQILDTVFIQGTHIPQFIKSVIVELRGMLIQDGASFTGDKSILVKALSLLLEAYNSQKNSFDPRLPLQIATISITQLFNGNTVEVKKQIVKEPVKVAIEQKPEESKKVEEPKAEEKQEKPVAEPETIRESIVEAPAPVVSEMIVPKKKKKKTKTEKQQDTAVEVSIETIYKHWGPFIRAIQLQNMQLYPMFFSSNPRLIVKDEMLQTYKLEVAVKFDFHKKRIENPTIKPLLNKLTKQYFGAAIQVVCVVDKESKQNPAVEQSVSAYSVPAKAPEPLPTQPVVKKEEVSLESAFSDILGDEVEGLAASVV